MKAQTEFVVRVKRFWQDEWQVVAVVCNQWGDTGKGKIVDILMLVADACIRGHGGANAGHTLVIFGKKIILHLVPSGIMHDIVGKINVIGRGVAFDPNICIIEIEELHQAGVTTNNLRISHEAPLMLPYHLFRDRISAACKGIGTTGRGIGPLYTDFTARRSLFVNDLLNPDVFRVKLRKFAEQERAVLTKVDRRAAEEVLTHEHLHNGYYFDPKKIIDVNKVMEVYMDEYALKLRQYIADTGQIVRDLIAQGKKIVPEGAQGALLGILHGTTEFQTSSDCGIEGLAQGCHLKSEQVDHVVGIVKGPVMTRVGAGPFPTEIGGKKSDDYCKTDKRRKDEEKFMPKPQDHLNDDDDFLQGMAIRQISGEYGATTGRTRRVGWLDLVALAYSARINGTNIALTKFDVLRGVKRIKLCVSYTYQGKDYSVADLLVKKGDILNDFVRFSEFLYECRPNYVEFEGWDEDISDITDYDDLPQKVKVIINFIEQYSGCHVDLVSVGPDREQTIFR